MNKRAIDGLSYSCSVIKIKILMTTKWYNIAIMYSYLIYMYLMNDGGNKYG